MAKRTAEKELTDRNWDVEDREEEDEGEFQAAPAPALAVRKIRGLPARKTNGAAPPPGPSAPLASNGFSGFGAAPAATPIAPSPFAPSSFGAPAALPTSNPFAALALPSVAPAAPAPNPFAQIPMDFSFSPTVPVVSPSKIETYYKALRGLNLALVDSLTREVEKNPFVDMGGAGGALETVRTRYEEHRRVTEEAYQPGSGRVAASTTVSTPAVVAPPPAAVPVPVVAPVVPTIVSKAPTTGMPVPPATFGSFGAPVKKSTSTGPAPVGFVPTLTKSSGNDGGFSFPKTAVVPSAPVEKKAPVKLSTAPAAPSPLRFGQSAVPVAAPVAAPSEKKVGFNFGASFGSIAKGVVPDVEGKELVEAKNVEGTKEGEKQEEPKKSAFGTIAIPTTSPFATPALATPTTPSTSTFSFNAPPATTPSASSLSFLNPIKAMANSPPITTGFGMGASPPSFGFGAGLKKDEVVKVSAGAGFSFGASSAFTFGASSATPAVVTTGFALPAAAAPVPQPFSFGAPPPAAALPSPFAPATSASSSAAGTPFSFGSPAVTPPPAASPFAFGATPPKFTGWGAAAAGTISPMAAAATTGYGFGSTTLPPSAGAAPTNEVVDVTVEEVPTPGPNPLAQGGAGEENETVLHTSRGKVYTISGSTQTELGIANLYVKESAEGVRRLLARNEVTGAVMINFRLGASLSVQLQKCFLTFQGFTGTTPTLYRIRLKDPATTEGLRGALESAARV